MKKTLSFFLFLFIMKFFCYAGQAEELFQKANEAFQNNNFKEAIKLYEQIGAMNFQSTELEYNLGNAYFREKNIGKAILHYERALLISPGDEDVIHNLSLVRDQVSGRDALPAFFLTAWWRNTRMALSSGVWGTLALVLWWLGCGGLCLWLFGKTREWRKLGFWVGVAGITLSLLPVSLAWSRMAFEENTRQAIIMQDQTTLKSAPDDAGSAILNLNEGEKIDLLDQLGGFWQVRLANGEKGWVSLEKVEEI
ncbi:MAG: tetratricopeptide repeat protein [Bacteroidota bacterium]